MHSMVNHILPYILWVITNYLTEKRVHYGEDSIDDGESANLNGSEEQEDEEKKIQKDDNDTDDEGSIDDTDDENGQTQIKLSIGS